MARARSPVDRYALRDDIASPSGSRTVGRPITSVPRLRSAAMRRITTSCWKSFSPKNAESARLSANSLATTVHTPRK